MVTRELVAPAYFSACLRRSLSLRPRARRVLVWVPSDSRLHNSTTKRLFYTLLERVLLICFWVLLFIAGLFWMISYLSAIIGTISDYSEWLVISRGSLSLAIVVKAAYIYLYMIKVPSFKRELFHIVWPFNHNPYWNKDLLFTSSHFTSSLLFYSIRLRCVTYVLPILFMNGLCLWTTREHVKLWI